jgi:hypothetical protein
MRRAFRPVEFAVADSLELPLMRCRNRQSPAGAYARALVVVAMLVAIVSPASAASLGKYDVVTCPAEMSGQLYAAEVAATLAPYEGDVDPLPPGTREPSLPAPKFARAAKVDPEFPRAGRAVAILLVNEQGRVDQVLVTCATSAKLIDPIVTTLRKARPGIATRGGVPVKSTVVVPLEFGH